MGFSWLHPGVEARLCNLAKFPKLEGQTVQVLSWREEKGRWNCLLPNGGDVNVYPVNLEPLAMPAERVRTIEAMLEEGQLLEAWRAVRGSASAPPELRAALDARLQARWEVVEARLVITEEPGGGVGYRAAKPIQRGDALLVDHALCSHLLPVPTLPQTSKRNADICLDLDEEDAPQQASQAAKEAPTADPFYAMADGQHSLIRVLEQSTWECTREPGHVAYFVAAAILNHSCCPNAFADASCSRCVVRALANICEGEEVCISYVPVSDDLKKRQEKLKRYGFSCTCKRCEEEARSNPFAKVPCKCGEHCFAFGTFSEGVLIDQKCPKCSALFNREESRHNLLVVTEANARQGAAFVGSEQYEAIWAQLKKLTSLERVVAVGGVNGIPPLHTEAILLLDNMARLHHHLALRLKGDQKTQAFQAFHKYKKLVLERLEQRHGSSTAHRDACYLRTLNLLVTTEGASAEDQLSYKQRLEELCHLQFGQQYLPAALSL